MSVLVLAGDMIEPFPNLGMHMKILPSRWVATESEPRPRHAYSDVKSLIVKGAYSQECVNRIAALGGHCCLFLISDLFFSFSCSLLSLASFLLSIASSVPDFPDSNCISALGIFVLAEGFYL